MGGVSLPIWSVTFCLLWPKLHLLLSSAFLRWLLREFYGSLFYHFRPNFDESLILTSDSTTVWGTSAVKTPRLNFQLLLLDKLKP